MKTAIKRTIEVEDIVYRCDFCDYGWTVEHGSRKNHMVRCRLCDRHGCHKHMHQFSEDGDHVDAFVCEGCRPRFNGAWDWALANAGRYDSLMEVTNRRLSETPVHCTSEEK